MDGLSESMIAFHRVLWSDAELLGVAIDYANVSLTLRESTGRLYRVVCEGYIGYKAEGFWDEVVVAQARLDAEGVFLERCTQSLEERLGSSRLPSGCEIRNRAAGQQLTIELSDGCEVLIAMKRLHVNLVNQTVIVQTPIQARDG